MKKLFTLVSTALLVCLLCVPVLAEWEVNEDTSVIKYQKSNGEYAAAEWMDIDGKQYYFYQAGDMATGKMTIGNGEYYFDENGVLQSGFAIPQAPSLYE